MKKFIYKTISCISIAGVLSYLALVFLSPLYWNNRIPIIKRNIFRTSDSSVSIVLGSSHSFHGINSSLLKNNFYNLASISQGLFEDYSILKYYKHKKIKNIILPISYFSNFSNLTEAPINGERVRIFDYEVAFNTKYKHDINYYENKFNLVSEIAKAATQLHFGSKENSFDEYGNELTQCSEIKYDLSDSITAFSRHNFQSNFQERNPFLDSIIIFCSHNEIKLNIVVFPFTKGYQNAIKNSNTKFEQFLNTIKAEQSEKVKFIDCRNLITQNEEIYFLNADHLSPCGRDSLSNYLKRVILK